VTPFEIDVLNVARADEAADGRGRIRHGGILELAVIPRGVNQPTTPLDRQSCANRASRGGNSRSRRVGHHLSERRTKSLPSELLILNLSEILRPEISKLKNPFLSTRCTVAWRHRPDD
jgi:hypothetical protein